MLPPGEFNGMSSQNHVSHYRVLPLGEFTVTISEPHAISYNNNLQHNLKIIPKLVATFRLVVT